MGKEIPRLERVERRIEIDKYKIYDSLPKVIEYLQRLNEKYPNSVLDEEYISYEDYVINVMYHSPETDKEYDARVKMYRMVEQNRAKQKANALKHKEKLKELKRLQKEVATLEAKL